MRELVVGAAQLGPIARDEPRRSAVGRMIALLEKAAARGCGLVVFPELALTTFFPRWYTEDQAEIDAWFETEMPNAATQPLFERAMELGIGFYLGYAELTVEDGRTRHHNTAILVDAGGRIVKRTARSICPAMPRTSRGAPSSISRSAISSRATTISIPSTPSAARSPWRSATTAAGRRSIARRRCAAPR